MLDTGEGLRVHWDFYDNALSEPCSFVDGHCLPVEHTQQKFIDAACTDPVIEERLSGNPSCTFPRMTLHTNLLCESAVRPIRVGKRVPNERAITQVYLRGADGECVPIDRQTELYRYEELPRSEFVAVSEELRAGPGRLKARYLLGSDGSRFRAGWYDTELGVACHLGTSADESARCLPDAPRTFDDDARCPDDAFYAAPSCGSGPEPGYRLSAGDWLRGTQSVYAVSDPTGTVRSTTIDAIGFATHHEIMPHALAPLSYTRIGGPNIMASGVEAPDLPTEDTRDSYFELTDFGACHPARDRDGTLRCLSPGSNAVQYADPACTKVIVHQAVGALDALQDYGTVSACERQGRTRYYEPGAPIAPGATKYVRDANGECQARELVGRNETATEGVEVLPDRFPLVTLE